MISIRLASVVIKKCGRTSRLLRCRQLPGFLQAEHSAKSKEPAASVSETPGDKELLLLALAINQIGHRGRAHGRIDRATDQSGRDQERPREGTRVHVQRNWQANIDKLPHKQKQCPSHRQICGPGKSKLNSEAFNRNSIERQSAVQAISYSSQSNQELSKQASIGQSCRFPPLALFWSGRVASFGAYQSIN